MPNATSVYFDATAVEREEFTSGSSDDAPPTKRLCTLQDDSSQFVAAEVALSDSGVYSCDSDDSQQDVAKLAKSTDESAAVNQIDGPVDAVNDFNQVATNQSAAKRRGISWGRVNLFYFPRCQGFMCVPTQGGSTMGMTSDHEEEHNLTIEDHASILRDSQLRELETIGAPASDINAYCIQPIAMKRRRTLLRDSGVERIEQAEKADCAAIRTSREVCGCQCVSACEPDTCICASAGIPCQVDRPGFPCSCNHAGCQNEAGRVEFNLWRVRTHFLHTIVRLNSEHMEEPTPLPVNVAPHELNSNLEGSCRECADTFDRQRISLSDRENLEALDNLEQMYNCIQQGRSPVAPSTTSESYMHATSTVSESYMHYEDSLSGITAMETALPLSGMLAPLGDHSQSIGEIRSYEETLLFAVDDDDVFSGDSNSSSETTEAIQNVRAASHITTHCQETK